MLIIGTKPAIVSCTIFSISNPGKLVKLTMLPPAVLNTLDFDRIMPSNTSYILGLFLLNPSGSLPILSSIFLDLAVACFKVWSFLASFFVGFCFDTFVSVSALFSLFSKIETIFS